MKTKLTLLLLFAASLANAQLIYLDLGSSANDGTGDKLRPGGIKINTNFFWLSNFVYTASNDLRTAVTTTNGLDSRMTSLEGMTNSFGGSGEVNLNGEISVTNATRVGLVYGKSGVTNLLRSVQGGNGIVLTNQGTNVMAAIDPAVVASQANLTSVSNVAWTADNWNTNRVNAALTNNNAGAVTLASTLSAQSTTVSALTVQNITDALAFFDDGGLASEAAIGAGLTLDVGTGTLSVPAVTYFTNWTDAISNRITSELIASNANFVRGPGSATDNALAVYDSTTGKLIKNSTAIFSTASNLSGIHNITSAGTNYARVFEGTSTTDESLISVSNGYFRGRLNVADFTQTNVTASRVAMFNSSKNLTNEPSGTLFNLAANPYVAYTNALTKTSSTVAGAGDGSTNYLLTLSTNALNDFYLGSSNVHIYTVAGATLGSPIYWNAIVTNLSANTWGINFSSATNRWKFSGVYGTNAPSVLTNNTALMLSGRSDGSNNLVGYTYFAPGL